MKTKAAGEQIHKDVEEYFNRTQKKSFIFSSYPPLVEIETTARVIDDEPDRSVKLFNHMHHFVETGKVEG